MSILLSLTENLFESLHASKMKITDPAVASALASLRAAVNTHQPRVVAYCPSHEWTGKPFEAGDMHDSCPTCGGYFLKDAEPMEEGSLRAAKKFVSEKAEDGVVCPCCGIYSKMYARKLNADMSAWLIQLVVKWKAEQPQGNDWVDVRSFPLRGGDYGKLLHWKLVERKPNDNANKRTSGLWRPTVEGVQFAMGRRQVPSHVYLYDNKVHRFSEKTVSIGESLGKAFSYMELMRGFTDEAA